MKIQYPMPSWGKMQIPGRLAQKQLIYKSVTQHALIGVSVLM